METKDLASVAQIFFQYGPFAILPFLIGITIHLIKQMKNASREVRIVLKRNVLTYQIIIIALIVVCVVYWINYLSYPKYYYGEIINVDHNEYEIKSSDLFINSSFAEGEYKIQWVWKKEIDKPDAAIRLIKGSAADPEKTFYLYSDNLKKKYCRLLYSKADGWLTYQGQRLPITPHAQIFNRKSYAFSGVLFAENQKINVEQIINQLQAVDFNVRYQAVEKTLKETSDVEKKNIINRGFEVLKYINQIKRETQPSGYNADYLLSSLLSIINDPGQIEKNQFKDWGAVLGSAGIDLIISGAGSKDDNIRNLSLAFLTKYKEDINPLIKSNFSDVKYQQDTNYIKGGMTFLSKQPGEISSFQHYANTAIVKQNPELEIIFQDNIKAQNLQKKAQSLKTGSGRLNAVIDLSLKIKEKNVTYKWGGKNENEGFDSSGFIAYILGQAKLIEHPEEYWSAELRQKVGEKVDEKKPKEIGDLVFYNGGVVMFYLGDNQIIGMTEEGIVIRDYQQFRGGPIQTNRIKY